MTIPIQCPHCGREGKAPDHLAGQNVHCPGCHRVVSVPGPAGLGPITAPPGGGYPPQPVHYAPPTSYPSQPPHPPSTYPPPPYSAPPYSAQSYPAPPYPHPPVPYAPQQPPFAQQPGPFFAPQQPGAFPAPQAPAWSGYPPQGHAPAPPTHPFQPGMTEMVLPDVAPLVTGYVQNSAAPVELPPIPNVEPSPSQPPPRPISPVDVPIPPNPGAYVMAGFRGKVPPAEVPPSYNWSMALAVAGTVMFALMYGGLLLSLIGLTLAHILYDWRWIAGGVFGLGAYLLVALTGLIMIAFFLKPFFAGSHGASADRALEPWTEPLLFDFVKRVSDAVGAPPPTKIVLSMDVNASASLDKTDQGEALVLTIGAMLVTGMTVQQLGGVLAHEFGHFAQRGGMRVCAAIRFVTVWLARAVFEQDRWDIYLVRLRARNPSAIFFLWPALGAIWVSRFVMWIMMILSQVVSGVLLRQMEYDADRYETRFAGTHTFESSVMRLRELGEAFQLVEFDFFSLLIRERLANDLPRLVAGRAARLPDFMRAKMWSDIVEEKVTFWSFLRSHPHDRDRIRSAREENAPGVFSCPLPATALFTHFDALTLGMTWDFYKDLFGQPVPSEVLVPVEQILEQKSVMG